MCTGWFCQRHMHQHVLFAPSLPQTSAVIPALATMRTQDTDLMQHLPKEATRVHSFTPITAFHKTPQMSFRSPRRGRGGALHIRIAWHIYYQEQIKKVQLKSNSLYRASPPDSVQHKESCVRHNPDSPRRQSACRNVSDGTEAGKTEENVKQFNYHPSHLDASSLASSLGHTAKRGRSDREKQLPDLHQKERMDEKEEHGHQQLDTCSNASPLLEKPWKHRETPVLNGRHCWDLHDRKRKLECSSSSKVKRVKLETSNDQFESGRIPNTHLSSHTVPVQHVIGEVSAFYSNSTRPTMHRPTPARAVLYPGLEMYPHQTAMWDIQKKTDLPCRQNLQRDITLNTCRAIRIPCVAQRHGEAFNGFSTLPLYFPPVLRQQETSYIRQREFLQSHHENPYLPHCGFITTSYLEP